jgi:hypothetical protein
VVAEAGEGGEAAVDLTASSEYLNHCFDVCLLITPYLLGSENQARSQSHLWEGLCKF